MNASQEIRALQRMTVDELRAKYVVVFGEENRSRNKPFLRRKIATRIQSRAEGGLTERARRRAAELAADSEIRVRPRRESSEKQPSTDSLLNRSATPDDQRLPAPGAVLTRKYRGQEVVVRVLGNGFEFQGTLYRSLTAVTKAITGSHWNGFDFFSLVRRGGRS